MSATDASRMTERQWERRLIEHARFLAEAALSDTLFEELVRRALEDYPGHIALIRYDSEGRMLGCPIACGGVEERLPQYATHFYRVNPYPEIVLEQGLKNCTAIMSRYLSRPRLWQTEYYNDFLLPAPSVRRVRDWNVRPFP
jgi:hypothetical protein